MFSYCSPSGVGLKTRPANARIASNTIGHQDQRSGLVRTVAPSSPAVIVAVVATMTVAVIAIVIVIVIIAVCLMVVVFQLARWRRRSVNGARACRR